MTVRAEKKSINLREALAEAKSNNADEARIGSLVSDSIDVVAIDAESAVLPSVVGDVDIAGTITAKGLDISTGSASLGTISVSNTEGTGLLGTDSGYVRLLSGADILNYASNGSVTIFYGGGNGTERARIDSSGNLLVGTTTATGKLAVNGTAHISGGVYLGGTGAANHLDDYEEGTFIPLAKGTSVAGTGTYASAAGNYTKIGQMVLFKIYLNVTAHTGSGNLVIGGLPFTSANTSGITAGGVTIDRVNGTLTKPANHVLHACVNESSTDIAIRSYDASSTGTLSSDLALDSVFAMEISGSYIAA